VHNILTRIQPAAVVATGLLFSAPAAGAASNHQGTKESKIIAKIALGDKRPAKAKKAKRSKKAKISQVVNCQNTNLVPAADNLNLVRDAILCLHNQVRAQLGLPALKDNARLRKAALGQSDNMVEEGYFDHTSPNGDTFVDRILDAGYVKRNDGWTLGENLAWGTGDLSTPQGVMNAWMNSAGHKANIVKKAYEEVGIGIRIGVPTDNGVGATITADFGARL
jgi:uncharacterized protein YkwD